MRLHIERNGQFIRAEQVDEDTWRLRLTRPKKASLYLAPGEIFFVMNDRGEDVSCHRVRTFSPILRYGMFTRTATVCAELLFEK